AIVAVRVAAPFLGRDGELTRHLGELLAFAGVRGRLLVLDRRPFGMSGHGRTRPESLLHYEPHCVVPAASQEHARLWRDDSIRMHDKLLVNEYPILADEPAHLALAVCKSRIYEELGQWPRIGLNRPILVRDVRTDVFVNVLRLERTSKLGDNQLG